MIIQIYKYISPHFSGSINYYMGIFECFFRKEKETTSKVEKKSREYQENLQANINGAIFNDVPKVLNTSSVRERENDVISNLEIITYKKDNGIVSAYFNRKALVQAIYKRAKNRTNNFTISDRNTFPFRERKLKIEDLSDIKCLLYNKTISNGEFVSKDDFVLVLGLDPTIVSHLELTISPFWETWIMWGIKIYSSYEGYFTNCIEERTSRIGGTEVKDGELLFKIELANKPKVIETAYKDIRFIYSMLSKEYLESVPDDCFVFKEWLVPNYSEVKKGDDVIKIEEYKVRDAVLSSTIKAPYSGLLVYKFSPVFNKYKNTSTIHKGDILFTIYSDKEKLKESYPNEITVITDDFTKFATIKGCKCGGNYIGFNLRIIFLNFENRDGKNYVLLTFRRKDINLNKKCALHLLLDNGFVITLSAISNPIKEEGSFSTLKLYIPKEYLNKLETNEFVKWQIINGDGMLISSGDNTCCLDENDTTDITSNLSREVFRDFIVEFNKLAKENYPEEEQTKEDAIDKAKDSCYVYLMIDTTNNFYKIGISNNPRYREHTLQSDKPTIELLCSKEYPSRAIAEAMEASLHKVYANKRIRGEWFKLDDGDVTDVLKTLQ